MFSFKSLVINVQVILGGLAFMAVGLSQAFYGWISDGLFARILYGVVGTGFGAMFSIGGAYMLWLQFFPNHDTEPDENIEEITLTKQAAAAARKFMPDYEVPLRVSVKNAEGGGYNYSLKLEARAPRPDDLKIRQQGIDLLVSEPLIPLLSGTTIDFQKKETGAGFHFDNPNAGQTLAQATANYKLRQRSAKRMRVALISGVALLSLIAVGGIGALVVSNLNNQEPQMTKKLTPEEYEMFHGRRPPAEPAAEASTAEASTAPKSNLQPSGPVEVPSGLEPAKSDFDGGEQFGNPNPMGAMFDREGVPIGQVPVGDVTEEVQRAQELPLKRLAETRRSRKLDEEHVVTRSADSKTNSPAERTKRYKRPERTVDAEAPHREAGDVEALRVVSELPKNRRSIYLVEISPNGQRAIIGNDAGDLQVFDLVAKKNLFSTSRLGFGSLETMTLSQDGGTVVSGYYSGKVVVWDLQDSGKLTQRMQLQCELKKPVKSLAIDNAGRIVAAGSKELTVWDLETEQVIFKDQLRGTTTGCQFFDGGRAIAYSDGASAKVVSVSDGRTLKSVDKVANGIRGGSAISADGKLLVTASGLEAQVTSLETGEPIGMIDAVSAKFSNDGKHLIAKWDDELLVWGSRDLVCAAKIELESSGGDVTDMNNGRIITVVDRKQLKTFEFVPAP